MPTGNGMMFTVKENELLIKAKASWDAFNENKNNCPDERNEFWGQYVVAFKTLKTLLMINHSPMNLDEIHKKIHTEIS